MTRTISTRTISTHRLLLLAAALAMAFSMLTAAPAHADHSTGCVVQGTATLNGGFGGSNASGTFSGTAVCSGGVFSASATFTYTNTTVGGTASGNLTIGAHTCPFSWERTGTTAVVTFESPCSGTAVAAFVPTSAPDAVPATAAVVGSGSMNHP